MSYIPHWPPEYYDARDIKYDLSRINALLQRLDNPHKKLPPVIHIAGTNGKGSTTAFLSSIFEASAYRTHVYTSPHILEYNERIVLAGKCISDEYFQSIIDKTEFIAKKYGIYPTFFEGLTAAAFVAFAEVEADILILETGMGGEFDATNVIDKILCAIITPISYDHEAYLGTSLLEIAQTKSGIIKHNCPTIVSKQENSVLPTILEKCINQQSECLVFGDDFQISKVNTGFILQSTKYNLLIPHVALLGNHQIVNAGVVAAACKYVLQQQFDKITDKSICNGIANTAWIGRLQKINKNDHEIWLDGAHNTAAAQILAYWLEQYMGDKKVGIIFCMTRKRDVVAFMSYFKNLVHKIYCVEIISGHLGYKTDQLLELLTGYNNAVVASNLLEEAIAQSINDNNMTLITGSMFLVADAYKLLNSL